MSAHVRTPGLAQYVAVGAEFLQTVTGTKDQMINATAGKIVN
jgi:hypothetical protein